MRVSEIGGAFLGRPFQGDSILFVAQRGTTTLGNAQMLNPCFAGLGLVTASMRFAAAPGFGALARPVEFSKRLPNLALRIP